MVRKLAPCAVTALPEDPKWFAFFSPVAVAFYTIVSFKLVKSMGESTFFTVLAKFILWVIFAHLGLVLYFWIINGSFRIITASFWIITGPFQIIVAIFWNFSNRFLIICRLNTLFPGWKLVIEIEVILSLFVNHLN